jgi:hypothetical protein
MSELKKPVLVVMSVLVIANIIALWIVNIVQNRKVLELEATRTALTTQVARLLQPGAPSPVPTPEPSVEPTATPDTQAQQLQAEVTTLQSDLDRLQDDQTQTSSVVANIQSSLQDIWSKLNSVEKLASTPQTTTTVVEKETVTQVGGSSVKEQVFYLGSGSTNSTSWVDVPAAQTTLDSYNFDIHEVKFEAGLSTIGGEVYARLVNKHNGVAITGSTVSHNSQAATWKSATIDLGTGSHTYQVQLRSSSGETATLHGAQIRIYTH